MRIFFTRKSFLLLLLALKYEVVAVEKNKNKKKQKNSEYQNSRIFFPSTVNCNITFPITVCFIHTIINDQRKQYKKKEIDIKSKNMMITTSLRNGQSSNNEKKDISTSSLHHHTSIYDKIKKRLISKKQNKNNKRKLLLFLKHTGISTFCVYKNMKTSRIFFLIFSYNFEPQNVSF